MKRLFLCLPFISFLSFCLISCTQHPTAVDAPPDYGFTSDASLKIITPASGENLKPGTTYTITFDIPPQISQVTVALYRKDVFQFNIVQNAYNIGWVKWTVPDSIFNSVHYRIKVSDIRFPDLYYSYSNYFYIKKDW